MFYTLFWNFDNSSALYNFLVIFKMMPEVSIYYLMAIFRAFLLIIGHKMNVCMIALDKSGINMKCSDGLKPLCVRVLSSKCIATPLGRLLATNSNWLRFSNGAVHPYISNDSYDEL